MVYGLIALLLIIIGVYLMSKRIDCPVIKKVKVDFFGHGVWINEKYKINLIFAKSNIMLNYPFAIYKIKRMDSYCCRYIRGYEKRGILSYHSYAQALDVNPANFPCRVNSYEIPIWLIEVAQCFKQAGFRWGGDWHSIFDPMHFEIGTRTV